ncbi:MAG: hypothetical protein WD795_02165 [Woeseia sp.]
MKLRPGLLLLPALHACIASADSSALHTLTVRAEAPPVAVAPQPPDRHFFDLPTLDFLFRIEARCNKDWQPESLSLSVADKLVSRNGSQLVDSAEQQIQLQIPAKQLAPIAIRSFCVIDVTDEGSGIATEPPGSHRSGSPLRTTVSAALSAHLSLRCSHGDEQKMTYVTQPLDITLSCEKPATADGIREDVPGH